jgi:hypothetical protein
VLSKNKIFWDETDFWILMGFDHAWAVVWFSKLVYLRTSDWVCRRHHIWNNVTACHVWLIFLGHTFFPLSLSLSLSLSMKFFDNFKTSLLENSCKQKHYWRLYYLQPAWQHVCHLILSHFIYWHLVYRHVILPNRQVISGNFIYILYR